MNAQENAKLQKGAPMITEHNRVKGFDPLRFLRRGQDGTPRLELRYKKLWFRLKHPTGRIKLYPLKITDQLAIIEARVFFDKVDAEPKASFIAQRDTVNSPGGLYIEAAQYAAADQALTDAGFGIHFVDTPGEEEAGKDEVITEDVAPGKTDNGEKSIPMPESVAETTVTEESSPPEEEAVPSKEPATPVEEEDRPVHAASAEAAAPVTEAEETTTADEEALEELREVFEETTAETDGESYTKESPVEVIRSRMSVEAAGNVIVSTGTCKGWTLSQVADRRPFSLKWYINGYNGDDNILRAAAAIMQEELQKAR